MPILLKIEQFTYLKPNNFTLEHMCGRPLQTILDKKKSKQEDLYCTKTSVASGVISPDQLS